MKDMGFGERWIRWISKCITSASISVLVNGSLTPCFDLARGLRQGCSLSPLLFNIVVEALHLMIEKACEVGLFCGFSVGKGVDKVAISHLQFADDLLMFCSAATGEIRNVKRVFRLFEIASGLKLNLNKCSLFGINIDVDSLKCWASVVGCSVGTLPSEYLGLPLGPKRNSAALWEPIVRKMHDALAS
ncbi:hypothetical protein HRI_000693300 [Hibiscus trionum]|uniref:Reverse transcriptase domain-containing protein n=1 Tax=Hibiscus trionum TaxID=183268 RepID=A0A9W7H6G9_HIBTR|nr:hypothetical protein HRI_000693300 [Hibiscus trionum]